MKHEAIYNLYPLVKHIVEAEDGVYTPYDANNNIVSINMSNVNVKAEELNQQADAEKQAKIDAKASALAKLTALGLTQEEILSILK
jgi:hypothetical protein